MGVTRVQLDPLAGGDWQAWGDEVKRVHHLRVSSDSLETASLGRTDLDRDLRPQLGENALQGASLPKRHLPDRVGEDLQGRSFDRGRPPSARANEGSSSVRQQASRPAAVAIVEDRPPRCARALESKSRDARLPRWSLGAASLLA